MIPARLTSISSSEVSSLELGFCLEDGGAASYPCSVEELHGAVYGSMWLVHGSEEFYEACHPSVAEGSYALRAAAAYAALFDGPWQPVELRAVGELHHRMLLRDAATGAEAVVDVVLSEHGEAAGGERVTVVEPAPLPDRRLLDQVARAVRLFDLQASEPLQLTL